MQPIRVALVDDHELLRKGVRAALEAAADIEVVGEAGTGEDALRVVAEVHPDVVVMDLDMPGDGGIAATRMLTRVDPHPTVIVLTMHSEEEGLVDALHAGASGYVTKNLTDRELVEAIRCAGKGEVYVRPEAGRVLAMRLHPRPRLTPSEQMTNYERLSRREQMVVRLVAEGHTGPQIGQRLGITAKTVDTYRHRIHHKIGLAHRTDYIRFALEIGLLKT